MSEIEIAKRGEQIFSLSFRRKDGNLKVIVVAHPQIENLLKSWGAGISSSIYDFGGRHWIFPPDVLYPQIWDLNLGPMLLPIDLGDGLQFLLAKPGYPLTEVLANGRICVNISFLRLVGVSNGVEFEIPGVHSISYLREVQTLIQKAVKKLYTDYLLPLDLTIQVNTQETRL